jgi:hypothetical protein
MKIKRLSSTNDIQRTKPERDPALTKHPDTDPSKPKWQPSGWIRMPTKAELMAGR